LHWADSESAALFERIAELPGPRLLIGTYRPEEVTSRQPVAALLARLERRHEVTHLRLGGLGPADTSALLAGATGQPVPYRTAMAAPHARGAGRYADLVVAARRGTASYLAIGSAYQALQLAELGLEEAPDDIELLAGAARAAWLAGLIADAAGYAQRWHDLGP